MSYPPKLGLGTGGNRDHDHCAHCVETALDVGYRHLDTAQSYGTEAAVGEGLRRSDVPRDEVFVATKVRDEYLGYDDVLESIADSFDRLGLDTVDLLYVHTPRLRGEYDATDTLAAFDELYDRGIVENVGVSNFSPALLDEAREVLDAPLFAHQAEMHPLLHQDELLAHAQRHDYHFVAYAPVARGEVYEVPELTVIAEKHGATEAQVSLAWLLQRDDVAAVPGADTEAFISEDYEALALDLDAADVAAIDGIDRERRFCDWHDAPWNRRP